MNEIIVQKFGGTSLASISNIKRCAEIVKRTLSKHNKIIVVVSAMGRLTDDLVGYLSDFEQVPEESDVVLSSGEQIAAGLFATALNNIGVKSCSMMSWQVPIVTTSDHLSAKIKKIYHGNISEKLQNDYVVVLPGFQGVTLDGKIATLGRGGSDITAVALASEFDADLCEIYTDVNGVMQIDPDKFHGRDCLDRIGYQQLLEMSLGADVLHTRAIDIAYRNGLNVKVRSSYNSNSDGTEIRQDLEELFIAGITYNDKKVLLTSKDSILCILPDIQPSFIIRDVDQVRLLIDEEDYKKVSDIGSIDVVENLSIVNIVGSSGIKCSSAIFSLLENLKNIKLEVFTTTEIRIIIVVKQKLVQVVIDAVLKTFNLNERLKEDV